MFLFSVFFAAFGVDDVRVTNAIRAKASDILFVLPDNPDKLELKEDRPPVKLKANLSWNASFLSLLKVVPSHPGATVTMKGNRAASAERTLTAYTEEDQFRVTSILGLGGASSKRVVYLPMRTTDKLTLALKVAKSTGGGFTNEIDVPTTGLGTEPAPYTAVLNETKATVDGKADGGGREDRPGRAQRQALHLSHQRVGRQQDLSLGLRDAQGVHHRRDHRRRGERRARVEPPAVLARSQGDEEPHGRPLAADLRQQAFDRAPHHQTHGGRRAVRLIQSEIDANPASSPTMQPNVDGRVQQNGGVAVLDLVNSSESENNFWVWVRAARPEDAWLEKFCRIEALGAVHGVQDNLENGKYKAYVRQRDSRRLSIKVDPTMQPESKAGVYDMVATVQSQVPLRVGNEEQSVFEYPFQVAVRPYASWSLTVEPAETPVRLFRRKALLWATVENSGNDWLYVDLKLPKESGQLSYERDTERIAVPPAAAVEESLDAANPHSACGRSTGTSAAPRSRSRCR